MAETCNTYHQLALRAQQQSVSAGLQLMQQGAGLTQLDVELLAMRQEAPAELGRWWEQQLASGRARELQAEITKFEKFSRTHPNPVPPREQLRKLRGVEAAIGRGDLPSEMVTAQGWFACKRERDLRELQASAQAQPADTSHLQRTPPLQSGNGAFWKDRVGRR